MLDRQIWEGAKFDNSAIRLTKIMIGYDGEELSETLKTIAWEIGFKDFGYLRFAPEKSYDPSSRTTIATYPKEWQTDYFLKGYEHLILLSPKDETPCFHSTGKHWPATILGCSHSLPTRRSTASDATASPSRFETEGVNAPWFPSLAITPGPSGPDISAQTCPGCKICRPLLTRLRTPTRSFRCPGSCCPGARRNA